MSIQISAQQLYGNNIKAGVKLMRYLDNWEGESAAHKNHLQLLKKKKSQKKISGIASEGREKFLAAYESLVRGEGDSVQVPDSWIDAMDTLQRLVAIGGDALVQFADLVLAEVMEMENQGQTQPANFDNLSEDSDAESSNPPDSIDADNGDERNALSPGNRGEAQAQHQGQSSEQSGSENDAGPDAGQDALQFAQEEMLREQRRRQAERTLMPSQWIKTKTKRLASEFGFQVNGSDLVTAPDDPRYTAEVIADLFVANAVYQGNYGLLKPEGAVAEDPKDQSMTAMRSRATRVATLLALTHALDLVQALESDAKAGIQLGPATTRVLGSLDKLGSFTRHQQITRGAVAQLARTVQKSVDKAVDRTLTEKQQKNVATVIETGRYPAPPDEAKRPKGRPSRLLQAAWANGLQTATKLRAQKNNETQDDERIARAAREAAAAATKRGRGLFSNTGSVRRAATGDNSGDRIAKRQKAASGHRQRKQKRRQGDVAQPNRNAQGGGQRDRKRAYDRN